MVDVENRTRMNESNGDTTLTDLPDCIILKIVAYLNKYQDIERVAQACWRLNDVCKDEILWRNLFHRHFRIQAGLFPSPLCELCILK